MAATNPSGKHWSIGRAACGFYRSSIDTSTTVYWNEGRPMLYLFYTPQGQPYILRVQGIPGMRTFSQLGHGGL